MNKTNAQLLGEFAEMMNELNSADAPELDEFLAKYPDNEELQKLSPTVRRIWRNFNERHQSSGVSFIFYVLMAMAILLFAAMFSKFR